MGMMIRVTFNNQNWKGKCSNAKNDDRLFKCKSGKVNIGYGKFKVDRNGYCKSVCWEADLCSKYIWKDNRNYDKTRAEGTVFFVYPDLDNSLVLWGLSKIKKVEGNTLYLKSFKPMPKYKWIRGLLAEDIFGKHWKQGLHRYINAKQEKYLINLVEKNEKIKTTNYATSTDEYLPTKSDCERAIQQIRHETSGNEFKVVDVLDRLKKDLKKTGKSLKKNWGTITRSNFKTWFK